MFMHLHDCKYCRREFVCGEARATCFRQYIVCRDCFWQVEVVHYVVVFILGIVAIGMTLVGIKLMQ